jgi:hypothetical protein
MVYPSAAPPLEVPAVGAPQPAAHGGDRAIKVGGDGAVVESAALATRTTPTTAVASASRRRHGAGSAIWVARY